MRRLAELEVSRIMVCGPAGSGKSTVTRRIGAKLDLPIVHLDQLYFEPDWVVATPQDFQSRVHNAVAASKWVIDGNYSETFDLRTDRAEALVFLDLPRWLCFSRVVQRLARHYQRQRPDAAPGCAERFDPAFLQWVWNWFEDRRPAMVEQVTKFGRSGVAIWLRSPQEVNEFLN